MKSGAQSLTVPQTVADTTPPRDVHQVVYLILLIQGIGILLPWNMFITARSYFVDYKMSKNSTGEDTNYATYFLSSVGFASHIPNLIFNWINVFIKKSFKGSTTIRIVLSISVEILIFVVTILMASIDSSTSTQIFFWCTMISIVILNMASGFFENIVFEMASKLPFKYPGAILLGCNVSGTIVSLIDLLTIAVAPEVRTAAISHFSTALLVLFVCLALYYVLRKNKFYRYHEYPSRTSVHKLANESTGGRAKVPYWLIFKKAFNQLFNVFFTFFVTLSIFPAMQADIRKWDSSFFVPEKYYENILCFLTFNTAAVMGSLVSNWIDWPEPKALLIPVILRVLFIPFFFFCNFQPTNKVRKAPVLIPNDWVYWAGGTFLGLSSGYFSCKAISYTNMSVESAYAPIAGMIGGAVIVTGIFFGVLLSMVFPILAEL